MFGWEHSETSSSRSIRRRRAAAAQADVGVVVARTYESEGFVDRPSLVLPNDQAQLIREVARATRRRSSSCRAAVR